ncbi:N-acetylneuraminate synthase [Prevotella brunnea]|uniref:N-acetylneuraminate synthase n=1 Tax=Prevotella brunnea TaxID=2508867 RepID=A0A5C8GJ11_9BACT|nr:N-acetylneuraminate synthase [Prevotella brunnea]MDR0185535.1 N-acetylneuraminate synthase [Prevotella brunnea]TXJ62033.1 N-acetylneuraminate synthase [Prevotella brunnea]
MAHTLIIAEAGVNHNGSIELAKQLIDAAADAGADIVKFQTFTADKLVSKQAKKAEYQQQNTRDDDTQYDMLKKLELSHEAHQILISYCHQKGIRFWSTAFDLNSIDYLHSLGMKLWKIPSGEITNYPYIRKIAQFREEVIMSTGMCDEQDIQNAINVLYEFGVSKEQITLLHCNTQYPTPFEDVNLRAMLTIKNNFGVEIGYSDHTRGVEVPIAAVALGAKVIEKHFTLNRLLPGPDHKASLEPDELKMMVTAIRNIEKALGDGEKKITTSERANILIARKSIVAAVPIKKGDLLTEENITIKRPGTGLSPMYWNSIIGTIANRDYNTDEQIVSLF